MPYYTDLRLVFEAIGDRQRKFNWFVTDLDYVRLGHTSDGPGPFDGPEGFVDRGPHWLEGGELTRIVQEHKLQFVWAVLSGFRPGITFDRVLLEVEPFADGNRGFWVARPEIQNPLAEIEIICWDSTLTLLLCRDRSLSECFRRFFPEAADLDGYNQARLSK